MSNFWDFVQLLIWSFFLLFYLLVLFQIIGDLFRDTQMGGFAKAIWLICLFVFPMITALIYIISRGRSMGERQRASMLRVKEETDAYIRGVGGKSPADQIAAAKALLDANTITQDEFMQLKAKALQ
ncbi:SHOCT domain-containing protein [Ramlibacter sp. G-1-2-2]|uniref:SHOCT domain-containing protein n=1 Tax=Ramlibacter agri TaxID=2728837 RepID=A0A848H8I9_9BURK|nr:SHOCT domain-containing protein [Ramlibacter agri]NML47095.1 SHOCT domain-containing protein [Ramlibacter agri]